MRRNCFPSKISEVELKSLSVSGICASSQKNPDKLVQQRQSRHETEHGGDSRVQRLVRQDFQTPNHSLLSEIFNYKSKNVPCEMPLMHCAPFKLHMNVNLVTNCLVLFLLPLPLFFQHKPL